MACVISVLVCLNGMKVDNSRQNPFAATGETLPEAAEITLKQEKKVLEQAELILQREKVVL